MREDIIKEFTNRINEFGVLEIICIVPILLSIICWFLFSMPIIREHFRFRKFYKFYNAIKNFFRVYHLLLLEDDEEKKSRWHIFSKALGLFIFKMNYAYPKNTDKAIKSLIDKALKIYDKMDELDKQFWINEKDQLLLLKKIIEG